MLLRHNAKFRKLKIGGRGLLGSTSYWLSDDQLLLVENSGYSERYRRYRLEEIKAVYASRTSRRLWVNLLSALLFCLTGAIPLLASGGNPAPLIWGGIFAGLFGIILLVNSARGPTCSTQIVTAVRSSRLKGITRLSQVEPLIAALRNATGPMPPSETGSPSAATTPMNSVRPDAARRDSEEEQAP